MHRLLRSDPEVRRELVERFGPEVIGSDGADRAVVARIVFNDPEHLDWLEELLHPRVVQEHSAWRRQLAEGPDPPAVTVTEVPLLYETGGDKRFDVVVVITAPPEIRAERRPIADEREQRLLAGGREDPARGLHVRQRRVARRAGCVRRRRDGRPRDVKRALGLVLLVGALLATFATLQSSKPGWWERLWYPLSYEQIVRGHARNYDLDPALLAAVIYQESKLRAGKDQAWTQL